VIIFEVNLTHDKPYEDGGELASENLKLQNAKKILFYALHDVLWTWLWQGPNTTFEHIRKWSDNMYVYDELKCRLGEL